LLQAQGLLTAEKLKLPVQLYDPAAYYNLVKDAPAYRSKRSKQLDRVLKSLGKN
jgi:outer membrane protein